MSTAPAATAALTATAPASTTAQPRQQAAAASPNRSMPVGIDGPPAGGVSHTPASPTQTTPPAGGAASSDWLSSLSPEAQAVAKAKGWKDPAAAIESYGSLEKLFGQDKAGRTIALPKDAGDKDAWGQIYDRLGRPKDAAGYELATPDGADPAFAATAAGKFHELGLTKDQGAKLAEWWNGQSAGVAQQQEAQAAAKSQAEHDALRAEWGGQADANMEIARRGARTFGFSGDELAAIEGAIGTRAMLERFFGVGQALGEDKLPGNAVAGATAKEQAQAKIARLRGDPQFMQRYTSSNAQVRAAAIAEMEAAYKQLES